MWIFVWNFTILNYFHENRTHAKCMGHKQHGAAWICRFIHSEKHMLAQRPRTQPTFLRLIIIKWETNERKRERERKKTYKKENNRAKCMDAWTVVCTVAHNMHASLVCEFRFKHSVSFITPYNINTLWASGDCARRFRSFYYFFFLFALDYDGGSSKRTNIGEVNKEQK